jgi:hypothetical protein
MVIGGLVSPGDDKKGGKGNGKGGKGNGKGGKVRVGGTGRGRR